MSKESTISMDEYKSVADDTSRLNSQPRSAFSPSEKEVEEAALGAHETLKQKAAIRKIDLRIIPLIITLYTLSFLDRVNIGNAKLYGFEEDLGLSSNQFSIAISVLFITYVLCEVPSNLVIKRLKPNRFIPFIVVCWGIVATCTGAVQNFGGLIAVRLLLGVFESGLMPGLVVYLTLFYTRRQLALRIAFLFTGSAIAGAIGGLIAYGVGQMDGTCGLRAWRWLMFFEGSPTIIMGIVSYFILPENLSTATFLTPEERHTIYTMKQADQKSANDKFHRSDAIKAFKDWQVWVFGFSNFCVALMFYGLATFMPSIIHDLGNWDGATSNALTVPVYALGIMVFLPMAWVSGKYQRRGFLAAGFGLFTIAGFSMLIAHKGAAVSFTGLFVLMLGHYVLLALPIAWLPSNKPRWAKRAIATAIQIGSANVAGAVMPFLYPNKDAPKYTKGYAAALAAGSIAICIYIFMTIYYTRVNRRRMEGKEDWKIEGKTEEEIEEMGDDSPRYIYTT